MRFGSAATARLVAAELVAAELVKGAAELLRAERELCEGQQAGLLSNRRALHDALDGAVTFSELTQVYGTPIVLIHCQEHILHSNNFEHTEEGNKICGLRAV